MAEESDIITEGYELTFRIDGLTPATLPMARLAEYMADLAKLLGEPESVHFTRLEKGSVLLVQQIEPPAVPKVQARLSAVRHSEAPDDAMKAFRRLDQRLANDNATGTLADRDSAEVVRFPGRDAPRPLDYPSFRQRGRLDGVLRRIGSKEDPPKIMLVDGETTWNCEATWELIERLQPYINKGRIRVHGDGRWKRGEDGQWSNEHFRVESFEALDEATWEDTARRLQAIAPWDAPIDLLSELADLRGSDETRH